MGGDTPIKLFRQAAIFKRVQAAPDGVPTLIMVTGYRAVLQASQEFASRLVAVAGELSTVPIFLAVAIKTALFLYWSGYRDVGRARRVRRPVCLTGRAYRAC